MRWQRISTAALAVVLAACGSPLVELDSAEVDRQPPSTTTSLASPSSTTTTAPTVSTSVQPQEDTPDLVDLSSIFAFVGERAFALEAVGYDEESKQYVVYTKIGEGPPGVTLTDEPPEVRPGLDLTDDGGGRHPEESHALVTDPLISFDVYWNGHGNTEIRAVDTGADALMGRTPANVFRLSSHVVFADATGLATVNHSPILRSHFIDSEGEVTHQWSVELDGTILMAFPLDSPDGILVAVGPPDDPFSSEIATLQIVQDGRVTRSIDAPHGLQWLQSPSQPNNEPKLCANTEDLGLSELTGIRWDIDSSNQLVTACQDSVPISTTRWCCGWGEFRGAIDSNDDGIEEVFVGGTSASSGSGGMYSLVDGVLAPIISSVGEEMYLFNGDAGGSIGEFGCVDGMFVQVEVHAEGRAAWADRIFYRIDGHSASIVEQERIDWELEDDVDELLRGIWSVYHDAPPEIVNDLWSCGIPHRLPLAGTSDMHVHLTPLPMSNATSCEVEWPRPYASIELELADGTNVPWSNSGSIDIKIQVVEPTDFLATDDGRFALLDWFICSHEGTIKTIYTGRYDPETGRLLEWRRIDPPEDYVDHGFYQTHPDRLVLAENGDIVGELDTDEAVLEIVINPAAA